MQWWFYDQMNDDVIMNKSHNEMNDSKAAKIRI